MLIDDQTFQNFYTNFFEKTFPGDESLKIAKVQNHGEKND
jgi:hypothetical protein